MKGIVALHSSIIKGYRMPHGWSSAGHPLSLLIVWFLLPSVFDTTSPDMGGQLNCDWHRTPGISPLRGSLRAAPIAWVCGWAGVPL